MPLRLLQVTLTEDRLPDLGDELDDLRMVQRWSLVPGDGVGVVQILLQAEDVEAMSDRIADRFGEAEGFRILLLDVQATLPKVEDEEGADGGESPEDAVDGSPLRISREELHNDVSEAAKLTPVYLVMVGLSTVVAAGGLLQGDVAIVIGAMVIAPLLGPNIALALSATLGDLELARRSLVAIAAGLGLALGLSLAIGALLGVDAAAPGIAPRTTAGLADIAIALSAGTAGSLAFTTGVPAVVVGVMVAVALLPPLVTMGLLLGSGQMVPAGGAALLVAINVTCINLAAIVTFLVQKVEPRSWWEADRAKKASRIAVGTWIVLLVALVTLVLVIF